MAQDFHIWGLCERMMFSQTAVRTYLQPLHACLANRVYAYFPAQGAYFEPEAYFFKLCLSGEALSQLSAQAGIASLIESGFLCTENLWWYLYIIDRHVIDHDHTSSTTDGSSSTTGGSSSTTDGTSSTTEGPSSTTEGSSSTTDGSSSTTGAPNTDGWTCAADSNRCYMLQQNKGGYQHQDGYRGTCAEVGGRLATFTSWSEFSAIQSVCGDVTTWGQPGCWIDGVATDDYEAGNPSNTAWRWPTDGANGSPDANDFLVDTQPNEFWSSGQPSGWNYWGSQEERCLQVMGNGLLNDQDCYTSLAGVCMIEVF